MKRHVGFAAVLILLTALATGCGGGREKTASESGRATADTAAQAMPYSGEAKPATPPAMNEALDQYSGTASAPAPETLDQKIIMNAELNIKIKDGDAAVTSISSAVRQAGGYVQETRQQGTKQQGRTIHITMRVPAGQYDNILELIADLGEEVTDRRVWTQDVTAEYLDLDARIKTKEIHLEQLRKLYDKGGSIKEMMELEQEIARVTADLESLKGRFRFLSNQVDFSTITVRLYEPGAPTPIKTPKTVLERMKLGFENSWNAMINVTGDFAVFLVTIVPVVFYLSILGGLGLAVYRVVKRFRRPPSA